MKKLSLLFVCIFFLSGCGLFDSGRHQITNGYSSLYIDDPYLNIYIELNDSISILGPCVSEVGFDDNFIIVLQHPLIGEFPREKKDTSISNYYIIPLINKINENPTKNIFGPLTKSDYYEKRRELNISQNLNFTIFPTKTLFFWSLITN